MVDYQMLPQPNPCPYCDRASTAVHAPERMKTRMPREGDFSVCIHCLNIAAFDKSLKLRKSTKEELDAVKAKWPGEWQRVQRIMRDILERKKQ